MKEYLHLFTPISEGLPINGFSGGSDNVLVIIEGDRHKGKCQFRSAYLDSSGKWRGSFPDYIEYPVVTHWLDLSKLTTKERAFYAIIDQVSAEVGGLSEQEITGIKLIARPKL